MRDSTTTTPSKRLDFATELVRYGPGTVAGDGLDVEQAEQYCRRCASAHGENFTVISILLPRPLRQDFANVYAYCRWSDDLADEIGDRDESLRMLDWWQQQLRLCYDGRPQHPVLLALQQTILRHDLPMQPFLDLLSAFRQDQSVDRYRDACQLLDYCQRSAVPVGRIVLAMARVNDPVGLSYSDAICTGLQLTNFCQDLSRDAAIGRIYAPCSMWARHGVTEEMLLARAVNDPLRMMLAEWVDDARFMFSEGWPLVDLVPSWLRTDVDLFVRGGLEILRKIEQADFDVWTKRPQLSKWARAQLLVRSRLDHWMGARRSLAVPIRGKGGHG